MEFKKYLDKKVSSLKGKNILITGANSGLGYSLSLQASYKGANVFMACRNKQRAQYAIEKIKKEVPNAKLTFLEYDQASFKSIKKFVNKLSSLKINIDFMVLNAGIYRPKKNKKTEDGFPLTCGTNYLGEFYLVKLLDKLIMKERIKKIVFVSSFTRIFPSNKKYMRYLENDSNKLSRAYFASKKMIYHLAGNVKAKYPKLEVSIMHPGIAVTRIVDDQLGVLPNWVAKFGNFVLKIFANTSDKSSLIFLKDFETKNEMSINYCFPRGLFHIMGYPKIKKIKTKKIKNNLQETVSNKLIFS